MVDAMTLAALSVGMTCYPLCRRLGGPHLWSGREWKTLPPQGFDPWTVQYIVSCYVVYVTTAQ